MTNLTPKHIESIIQESNLDEICDTREGDCVSVAVAIKRVFGGEYACAYDWGFDRVNPVHAAVKIEDAVFDGDGRTSEDALYDIAISGLKADEIYAREKHVAIGIPDLENISMYDEDVAREVEERLRKNK
jgi:hypothetical protein